MMKQGLFCYLLLALAAVGLVMAADEAAAPVMEEVFEGKGTFGVQTAVCEGDGEFSGEAEYSGDGEFMSEGGTFEGDGTFFISGGTFSTSDPNQKWTCEGSGTFVLPAQSSQAKFSGNGTISGDGTYSTQTGTFKGKGTYEATRWCSQTSRRSRATSPSRRSESQSNRPTQAPAFTSWVAVLAVSSVPVSSRAKAPAEVTEPSLAAEHSKESEASLEVEPLRVKEQWTAPAPLREMESAREFLSDTMSPKPWTRMNIFPHISLFKKPFKL
jgi:hypothetical protein